MSNLLVNQINGAAHVDINEIELSFLLKNLSTFAHGKRVASTNLIRQS